MSSAHGNYQSTSHCGSGMLSFPFALLFTLVAITLGAGWAVRDDDLFTPTEGAGYYLGIAGGSMLLLLLHYSARKRFGFMQRWGRVRYWLNGHIVLGLFGPVAILYHCNFHLGAINSNVALGSMLLVMFSGFVGRFLYLRLNQTLHGEIVNMEQMQRLLASAHARLEQTPLVGKDIKDALENFERQELAQELGTLRMIGRLVLLGRRAQSVQQQTLTAFKPRLGVGARAQEQRAPALEKQLSEHQDLVVSYIASVRRVAEFSAYRRIFALWHVIHIPLFVMLLLTGAVHVVAVHFLY